MRQKKQCLAACLQQLRHNRCKLTKLPCAETAELHVTYRALNRCHPLKQRVGFLRQNQQNLPSIGRGLFLLQKSAVLKLGSFNRDECATQTQMTRDIADSDGALLVEMADTLQDRMLDSAETDTFG